MFHEEVDAPLRPVQSAVASGERSATADGLLETVKNRVEAAQISNARLD